jgi:protein-tyrosine phosphatase
MSYLNERDRQLMAGLGVRVICDLRRQDERRREPTHWPFGQIEHLFWDDPLDSVVVGQWRAQRPATNEAMRAAMMDLYQMLPRWMITRLRGLFASLVSGSVPLVFHCAAGKDRTGVAAALILSAVGVSRQTIFDDYAMTNEVVDYEKLLAARHGVNLGLGDSTHPLLRFPEEARRALLLADVDYLAAMFDRIEQDFGAVEAYLETELGVGEPQREALKELLLEG